MVTDGKMAYANILNYSLSYSKSKDAIASKKKIQVVRYNVKNYVITIPLLFYANRVSTYYLNEIGHIHIIQIQKSLKKSQ